jgi:hypothetical protein
MFNGTYITAYAMPSYMALSINITCDQSDLSAAAEQGTHAYMQPYT